MHQRDDAYRRNYEAFELAPGEVVGQSWIASQGMLVLTNQRLLYEPMRTPKGLIEPTASLMGQGAAGKFLSGLIDATGALKKPWSEPLSEIASVDATGGSSLRITLTSRETREIEISNSLWSTRFSGANATARDEAVGAIRAAVAGNVASIPSIADPEPLDRYFVGTWAVHGFPEAGDLGTIAFDLSGNFDSRFVFFGAVPDGSQFTGTWWLSDPFGMLALQGRVVEPRGAIVMPLQVTIGIQQVSQAGFVGEILEGDSAQAITFTRR